MKISQAGIDNVFIARRRIYLLLVPAILIFGLLIRAAPKNFSPFFASYAPDILWAFLVFTLVAVLLPRLLSAKVALIALSYSVFMECSQLYQAPWINELRTTRIGGLMLGYAFLWSDLICYSIGVALGAALDRVLCSILIKRYK